MIEKSKSRNFLFIACFVALVATSFAFVIRIMLMDSWQVAFDLSETQKGEIFGAGFWPFGISIVLFSLVIDKIGYGRSMIAAFIFHLASALILFTAKGYWALYIGSVLNGLAAGTVEAVINPAVASMYPKLKTRMLTVLHAGWPGGIMLGGIMLLFMGDTAWKTKVLVILVPVIIYGIMLLKCKFPENERVTAGVSYRDMLREAGALSALIASFMIMSELGRVFSLPPGVVYGVVAVVSVVYLIYARALGRAMYIFMLLLMILLAITELGTDAWIKELRDPAMRKLGLSGALIVIYTSSIMMILRFCIAPIERRLKPLGVLLVSSLLAAAGLFLLATATTPMAILLTATVYGVGQSFFWPVSLGVVAERFPKGGALTLNVIAGVGMLGVGIIGTPLLGYIQDAKIRQTLEGEDNGALYEKYVSDGEKRSIIGRYRSLDARRVKRREYQAEIFEFTKEHQAETNLDSNPDYQKLIASAFDKVVRRPDDAEERAHDDMVQALDEAGIFIDAPLYATAKDEITDLDAATTRAKENAMQQVAVLPLIMAFCYLGLIIYFRVAHGGYQAVELEHEKQ